MRGDTWEDYLEGGKRIDLNTKSQPREGAGLVVKIKDGMLTVELR